MEVMEYQISIFTSNSYLSVKYLFYLKKPLCLSSHSHKHGLVQPENIWKGGKK